MIPDNIVAFSADFAEDKQVQWVAFLKRINDTHTPIAFSEIIEHLSKFLKPVIRSML